MAPTGEVLAEIRGREDVIGRLMENVRDEGVLYPMNGGVVLLSKAECAITGGPAGAFIEVVAGLSARITSSTLD